MLIRFATVVCAEEDEDEEKLWILIPVIVGARVRGWLNVMAMAAGLSDELSF